MRWRLRLAVALVLFLIACTSLVRAQVTAPANEITAAQARQKFEEATSKADEACTAAVNAARPAYLEALRKALESAKQDGKLELANWLKAEADNIETGNPASTERAKLFTVAQAQESFNRTGEKAQLEQSRALEAARKRFLADLESAKRAATRAGDLDEANRINTEIERAKTTPPVPPNFLAGPSPEKPAAASLMPALTDVRGLKFEWFNGENFEAKIGERTEYKIATILGGGTPGTGGASDHFSARWTGFIRAPRAGSYRVHAYADDGFRLKLNGKTILDGWKRGDWQNTLVEFTLEPQEVVFEMREDQGNAGARLYWTPPGETYHVPVPPTCFFRTLEAARAGRSVRPQGTGLTLTVFGDQELKGSVGRDFDDNIDWGFGHGPIVSNVPRTHFSIQWEGFIVAPEAGIYRFTIPSDDGCRLWIDRKIVVDAWHGGKHDKAGTVELTGGPQTIVVDFYNGKGPSHISLHWSKAGSFEEQIVPPSAFFLTKGAAEQAIARRKAGGK